MRSHRERFFSPGTRSPRAGHSRAGHSRAHPLDHRTPGGHRDAGLVGQVIGVLGAIGKDSSEAIGKIISAAQEGVASSIRQKAVTAIGEIGDVNPTVTPTLFKLKNDPDDNVAKAAQAALKKLQEKSESE